MIINDLDYLEQHEIASTVVGGSDYGKKSEEYGYGKEYSYGKGYGKEYGYGKGYGFGKGYGKDD
ncbi:MAG: hypothetical protein H0X31_03635 [Nostocaceae cyanobacterium]|nr:hypothetical protein [Nostocaceae cyanobacterium]